MHTSTGPAGLTTQRYGTPSNAARKVAASRRQGGGGSKGNAGAMPTSPYANLAHKDLQRMHGVKSAYEVEPGNPFATRGPRASTLDALADMAMAGLNANSPARGARRGVVCPGCGMQRSSTNKCFCNE